MKTKLDKISWASAEKLIGMKKQQSKPNWSSVCRNPFLHWIGYHNGFLLSTFVTYLFSKDKKFAKMNKMSESLVNQR